MMQEILTTVGSAEDTSCIIPRNADLALDVR